MVAMTVAHNTLARKKLVSGSGIAPILMREKSGCGDDGLRSLVVRYAAREIRHPWRPLWGASHGSLPTTPEARDRLNQGPTPSTNALDMPCFFAAFEIVWSSWHGVGIEFLGEGGGGEVCCSRYSTARLDGHI